jgi:hypothetical protein
MWIQPRSKSSVTGQPQPHSLSFGASWALPISTAGSLLGFSHIAWALSQITRGGGKAKFAWGRSQKKAFDDLKQCLCSAPVLSLPDLQHPFQIETDALDYAVGTVLTQHGHPVAYHSETLSDVVRKYPTYDK